MGEPLEQLAQAIAGRLFVELEASGRHVHVTAAQAQTLFGHSLTPERPLSQPGQYLAKERVTVTGPKGSFRNVAVLGPERKEAQVEISLTDGRTLGISPPVRLSGDVAGTPGVTLEGERGQVVLSQGVIAAQRMLDLPYDPAWMLQMHTTEEIFIEQVTRMLSHPNRPDALTCFNDTVARAVYTAAERADLQVGRDLGVIGNDNSTLCEELSPTLSSVESHTDEIARLAVQALLQYIHSDHPPQVRCCLEPDIIPRESTQR